MIYLLAAMVIGVVVVLVLARKRPVSGQVEFLDDDPALLQARDEALAALPDFRRAYEGGVADDWDFQFKVRVPAQFGEYRHIWIELKSWEGDRIVGALANPPSGIRAMKHAAPIETDIDAVEDWTFTREGKSYGLFSSRATLDRLPRAEQNRLRAMLSANPIPDSLH